MASSSVVAVQGAFAGADSLAPSPKEEGEVDHRRRFVLERSSTDIDCMYEEEEEDEGPHRHPHLDLERSLTAPYEEDADRRFHRRLEALERRRRESGAIQAGIWRSYSLRPSSSLPSWDATNSAKAAAALLENIRRQRGKAECAVPATISADDDDDDSQDLTGYSEGESEDEQETEIDPEGKNSQGEHDGKIPNDVPNSSTDLTDAETTDSERSRSSSSSSSDERRRAPPESRRPAARRRRRRKSRRRFDRKYSEMTHITECSSSESSLTAAISKEDGDGNSDGDSDDDWSGVLMGGAVREDRDRGGFDILTMQVSVPEERVLSSTAAAEEDEDEAALYDECEVEIDPSSSVNRDRLGIAPPRRPLPSAPAEQDEGEANLEKEKKERLRLAVAERNEDDAEATGKNDGTPATTTKRARRKKKKRRQRLNMRWAADDFDADAMHESGGFELDLVAPSSDIDSSFHSRASTANLGGGDPLDSSRHSHRCRGSFLDSSCHSRGRLFLDSSRHSRGGLPSLLRWSSGSGGANKLRRSAGSSGMLRSNSLLSLSSQNSAGGGGNLVAPPPTSLGRGCSQVSVFSDDASVGYDGQDHLDFSIHDYTGVVPEIKRNLSADDLISLATGVDDENEDDSRQQRLVCSAPDGGRFLLLGASSPSDDESAVGLHVLSPPLAEALQSHLPFAVSGQNFWLKYSLVQNGASLMTLLDNVPADAHTILAVETDEGEVFGSFTSTAWRKDWNYYGSGFGAFLWRMKGSRGGGSVFDQAKAEGEIEVFKWSGRNDFTQLCTSEKMAVGGGAEKVADWITTDSCSTAPGFGLCVDDDMFQGTSSPCATFESPPLSKIHSDGSPFNILNVEVWALTPCISVEEALKMEAMKTFHAAMRSSA